jgi:hypothetical protein
MAFSLLFTLTPTVRTVMIKVKITAWDRLLQKVSCKILLTSFL